MTNVSRNGQTSVGDLRPFNRFVFIHPVTRDHYLVTAPSKLKARFLKIPHGYEEFLHEDEEFLSRKTPSVGAARSFVC